ncbi:hypothetical protein MLD38_029052 [Melastoma candidum]|uniref:Uncharacterized protein n=1 Tax=Melastoma candidum TaxID=119954 RepID=A0ACB9N2Z0_9MYRT|nr:hypothetical protein MLD38_029052 [Melastoma candidum]
MESLSIPYPRSTFLSLLLVVSSLCLRCLASSGSGFTTRLIHRHSLEPLNDHRARVLATMRSHFHGTPLSSLGIDAVQGRVFPDNGQYLMKVSLGTPPVDVYSLVDTGSDLFWAQCLPCDHCYNQTKPAYDPRASSTYFDIPCQSSECNALDAASCATSSPGKCNYTYGYASTAYSRGFLAKEKITFSPDSGSSNATTIDVIFGCGHNNSGFSATEMGLMGLGRGRASFVTQMGNTFGARKFSHCLVPFHTDPNISSKISFGSGSEVTGAGVVSTPLVDGPDPTYYFVKLEGISVGGAYLPFYPSGPDPAGKSFNMFLDSGTPPTILPGEFYNRLVNKVRDMVRLEPIDDPELRPQLCYGKEVMSEGPVLTAHFAGGANVFLEQLSTFISPKEGTYCFAFVPNDNDVGIFGNFAQSNHWVGFDLEKDQVSFLQADCTKQ